MLARRTSKRNRLPALCAGRDQRVDVRVPGPSVVRLTRRARKAAVVAGRDLGNPALAHAFRLDRLYRTRGGTPPPDEDGKDVDGGDDGAGA